MKTLILSASPRRNGNTDDAARRCAELLAGVGEVAVVRIADKRIRHCAGCRKCMTLNRCVIRGDDLDDLFEQCRRADLLILACPVYWQSPPGAMKDFLDRSHGWFAHRRKPLAGRRAALISVATDGGFASHERVLAGWLSYYGATVLGKLRLLAREKGDLLASPKQMRKLDAFVRRVRRLL